MYLYTAMYTECILYTCTCTHQQSKRRIFEFGYVVVGYMVFEYSGNSTVQQSMINIIFHVTYQTHFSRFFFDSTQEYVSMKLAHSVLTIYSILNRSHPFATYMYVYRKYLCCLNLNPIHDGYKCHKTPASKSQSLSTISTRESFTSYSIIRLFSFQNFNGKVFHRDRPTYWPTLSYIRRIYTAQERVSIAV